MNELGTELLNFCIDLICLTKTWVYNESINFDNINRFLLRRYYCRKIGMGSGTAIFVKQNILFRPNDFTVFCVDKCFEICDIATHFQMNKTLTLSCYRSRSADFNILLEQIEKLLSKLYKLNIKIILCGDFDIDSYSDNSTELKNV